MNIPTQNHVQYNQVKSNTTSTQHQFLFMMSPSDLLATPSSECLPERCSRHRHWETYDNKTNLKQLTEQHANSAIQHQFTLKTQRKLKTGLGIFRSKANQLQVVLLGTPPF